MPSKLTDAERMKNYQQSLDPRRERFMPIMETCDIVGVSKATLYDMVRKGEVPAPRRLTTDEDSNRRRTMWWSGPRQSWKKLLMIFKVRIWNWSGPGIRPSSASKASRFKSKAMWTFSLINSP